MKTATINELKQELLNTPVAELTELCLRLAKFKKENKELLTYLLFEAHDEQSYIEAVQKEIDDQFAGMNQSNLYYVKKTLRKILRSINKYSRYTGSAQVTVELLIYYCKAIKAAGIPVHKSPIITNLYNGQVQKIHTALKDLHEDLQYDYARQVAELEI